MTNIHDGLITMLHYRHAFNGKTIIIDLLFDLPKIKYSYLVINKSQRSSNFKGH